MQQTLTEIKGVLHISAHCSVKKPLTVTWAAPAVLNNEKLFKDP